MEDCQDVNKETEVVTIEQDQKQDSEDDEDQEMSTFKVFSVGLFVIFL